MQEVGISETESIVVKYQERAHNPLLIGAGLNHTSVAIPWLGGKRLRMVFR
jgi:hypothetical protein